MKLLQLTRQITARHLHALPLLFLLFLLTVSCSSQKQAPDGTEPSSIEQEMKALYGENEVIEGNYNHDLAVKANNGIFVGQREDSLLVFKGIPYALQPTGDRRWRVAQPEPDSRLVREAFYFGHSAIQQRSQGNAASLYQQGEDCLTLNVWTAADGMRSASRPVMVWIHGGSYVCNGSVNPRDWGDAFVKAHPEVVFVSVNYRLGLMGFLDLSSLPDGKAYAHSGNLGILDQVEALRWVKRNIAAFGGDPDNVTIVGHSAGAGSVSILASIDEAQGLFKRAIMQSGSVAFTSSREDCQSLTRRVLDATGAKTVAELKALSTDEIIALNDEVGKFFRFPERDGDLIPENPYSRFDGFNSTIDMLIGSNADEVRYWIDAMGGERKFDLAAELWCRYIMMSLDSAESNSANSYFKYFRDQDEHMEGPQTAQAFLNDLMFRGPAIEMAKRHAQSGGKTYMYLWRQKLQTSPQGTYYGACHASEVCYVLNTGRQIKTDEVTDSALASEVQQMWVNFAATGNPSTPSHNWPAYESLQGATMILDKTSITVYNNDKLPGQLVYISPLLKEYISPIFSDLLDKAPWYAAVAIGTLVAFLLLLTWLIVKLRHRFKKNQSNKTNTSNE